MVKVMSIVLPAFNEERNILLSHQVITGLLKENHIPYELIYVNDGSKDHTWDEIMKLTAVEKNVIGINLSRNFGKEASIDAGLKNTTGDCVVVMDCDLQHSPEALIEMYAKWQEGYEVVEGIKRSRGKEGIVHSIFASTFYKFMTKAIGIDMENSSDYKLLDRRVVDELNALPEKNRFFRALSFWIGFKQTTVEYDVLERQEGETKWSLLSLMKYALNNIMSFTSAPLQLVTFFGSLYLLFAFILSVKVLSQYFAGEAMEGFTTVIILLLIIGSTILIALGVTGLYIGKIYQELKGRPSYIVKEKINHD